MQELCESTNTTDLEDVYVLLMMAKPLKPYLLFQWENGYITYTIISSINNQEQTAKTVTKSTNQIAQVTTQPIPQNSESEIKSVCKLLSQTTYTNQPTRPIQIHIDGGANRSITDDITLLAHFKYIKKYAINGVNNDGPALHCTGIGYLPWHTNTGATLYVKCYYSPQSAGTIISPTDIVITNYSDFHAWTQHSNIDSKQGYIEFHNRSHNTSLKYELYLHNGLWFYDPPTYYIQDYESPSQPSISTAVTVHRLTVQAQFELYHQRFGHPGERAMHHLHKLVDDVPQ
jgi:hypothetical protein